MWDDIQTWIMGQNILKKDPPMGLFNICCGTRSFASASDIPSHVARSDSKTQSLITAIETKKSPSGNFLFLLLRD